VSLGRGSDDELDHAIDDNERGLKDTIRVNPNEIVESRFASPPTRAGTCTTATYSSTRTAT
jgi:hypothetical protein